MKNTILCDLKTSTRNFLLFLVTISFCEAIMRYLILKEGEGFPFFLLFVPAQAILFSLFCGLFKAKRANNILTSFLLLLLISFYVVQLLYYRQFGSPFSVSFIKMGGTAFTEFFWAFKATLIKSTGYVLLILLPFFIYILALIFGYSNYYRISFLFRGILLLLVVVLWIGAIGGIRLGGNDKHSPYSVFTNAYSDTETSASKLGVLTTAIVESGAYFLGINSHGDSSLFDTSEVVYQLPKPVKPVDTVSSNDLMAKESDLTEDIPQVKYHIKEGIDFEYLKSRTEDSDIKALCNYFSTKPASAENEYTGMFEGYNLIYICAESFTSYAMNEKVTPLLCKMAQNGLVLNNYYTSFKNTTTNGEFAYSVSLWPDVSRKAADGNAVGSFACSSKNYMPYGLGNIFNALNVPTYAFHGYISSYYSRCDSWPNLGYKNMKFMYEGLEFENKWSPTDRELMEQTVDDFVSQDRFFTYYMTYSGHGDYTTDTYIYLKNNAIVRSLLAGDNYTDSEISYLCGSYELEMAMEYLVEKLEESGKLDKTLIVLAGDHIPYNFYDEEMQDMAKKAGLSFDYNFDKYKSTCIIYNAAVEKPIVCDSYCCNVDVLPTVLNLMGIDYDSRLIAGEDVLDSNLHIARLYNGNLLTEYVNYNANNGKVYWKDQTENWDDSRKEEYLNMIQTYSDNEYKVSLKLMEKDFYRFVWKNIILEK